jgi:hypothetical protein
MSTVLQLALLACTVIIAVLTGKIHTRLTHLDTSLGKLLAFLDGVSVERRKDRQDERNGAAIFRKTMVDVLMSCRSSIDAIRSGLDELSMHRRDTVEMQRPLKLPALDARREKPPPETVAGETTRKPEASSASRTRPAVEMPATRAAPSRPRFEAELVGGDRDSSESVGTRVMAKPSAAELEAGAPGDPASDAGRKAAGLARPKSQGREPPPARSGAIDAPPRSQTMRGTAGPQGARPLPVVVAPPMGRPRSTATLPSMGVVSPPRAPAASPAGAQDEKEA